MALSKAHVIGFVVSIELGQALVRYLRTAAAFCCRLEVVEGDRAVGSL
jgi:hypothetical protein